MDAPDSRPHGQTQSRPATRPPSRMTLTRASERLLVVNRLIHAPPARVFEAWTTGELFRQWWVPASMGMTLDACELDVRAGGGYRLVFRHPAAPEPMAFHGRYLEVSPPARLVWTNEEAVGNGQVTTVLFEEHDGQTLLVVQDLYPTQEALEQDLAAESISWNDEAFDQLDALLA